MKYPLVLLLLLHVHQGELSQGSLDTKHTSDDKATCKERLNCTAQTSKDKNNTLLFYT